jgi:SAM-dependent methyltransferase
MSDAELSATAEYWNAVAAEWQYTGHERTWRMVSDAVNVELLKEWLEPNPAGAVLKTDLFDEVTGAGLVPWLSSSFARVAGIDVSPLLVELVQARFPRLQAEPADVRRLPFPDAEFDAVVSNSTLDHLRSQDDIAIALREFHRVTRRGGTLLVTLDNPVNPVVAIRNVLADRLRGVRVAAFAVGATCGPGRLRSQLVGAGFEVIRMGAVFHCPRVLAVLAGQVMDRHGSEATKRRYVRLWTGFERLGALPTRFLTGYFVAALARKP